MQLTIDSGAALSGPMASPKLLIAWHSRTGASRAMAHAAFEGAADGAVIKPAHEVMPQDILAAGAYLFACPENLASMSGEMKEMFDRCYYPVLGKIEGRAYATVIAAGSDGEGAQRQIDRIATGWRLKRVTDAMIVNFDAQTPERILATKQVPAKYIKSCKMLGSAMVEGLSLGIY